MVAVVGGDDGRKAEPGVATSLDDARTFRLPKLRLAERRLFHVPPEIGRMRFLEELDLSGNRISEAPTGCFPRGLHALSLTGNDLEALPHDTLSLPFLQRLNCGANRLSSCDEVFHCDALLHAGLSFNAIASFAVPDGAAAAQLMSLDLSNNNLEDLPQTLAQLAKLPRLAALSLKGNPFCLRKDFHEQVSRQLPKLAFFNEKKRVVKDVEGEEGERESDHFPMPQGSEEGGGVTQSPEADSLLEAKNATEASGSSQTVTLRLEMRSLAVKDPSQPVAPEWMAQVAEIAAAAKAKKGKAEDSVPLIPPVRYSVEWEMADGRAVSTFCKKVEIDPRKLAELTAATASAEGGGKPTGRGTGSRGGSRDGRKKTPETPTTGAAVPSMDGCSTVVMELPANMQTRDWLRSGFKCKLWRVTELLERTVLTAATEREAEQWSYSFRKEEAMLAVGTCCAPDVIDAPGLCKVKVPLLAEPALWDANGVRMGLLDERHSTAPVATIVATFHLHWTPPPPPEEPVASPTIAKGKSVKKK